jgi:indolepyruvate ferredoxin oxidoreductase, alpha subunit
MSLYDTVAFIQSVTIALEPNNTIINPVAEYEARSQRNVAAEYFGGTMSERVLLGDEAVAQAAIDAGITAAYAYPGTPSTEILEYLIEWKEEHGSPHAGWCANEKTAYEEALGVSLMGRRAMVTMKHVGLNVAADPFMNSALLDIAGGVVLGVADDPGMHSSQNEQDSRYFADFAKIICLEPANQQEAYDMTFEGFELSEKFQIPIMIRLVTRLAHSRATISTREPLPEKPLGKNLRPGGWMLLPGYARRNFAELVGRQGEIASFTENSRFNALELRGNGSGLGVITTGIARNYFVENISDLDEKPSHLHISAYPIPFEKVRALAAGVEKIVVIEEGYPYVERYLRGILDPGIAIAGKLDGSIPITGELTPDNVRPALGLEPRKSIVIDGFSLPARPPQFCKGCAHADTFNFIKEVLSSLEESTVTSDIGCYALGALPPYEVPETIVDMGASVSMAKGAAEAGGANVVAVIGDSTFLHSGVTPLLDAVASNVHMTVIIVDNQTVAMTGGQPTLIPSSSLSRVVEGAGVDPEHIKVVEAHRTSHEQNMKTFKTELDYPDVSVIIAVRECVETAKKSARSKAT